MKAPTLNGRNFPKYFLILTSFVFGFWTATQIYGKKVGAEGVVPNTRIHIYGHLFSPHHWMIDPIYAFIIWLIYFKLTKKVDPLGLFAIFFLLGMGSQGFTYSDWYVIFDQPIVSGILVFLTFSLFVIILIFVFKSRKLSSN